MPFTHYIREVLYVYCISFSPTYSGKLKGRNCSIPARSTLVLLAHQVKRRDQRRFWNWPSPAPHHALPSDPVPAAEPAPSSAHAVCVATDAPPLWVEAMRMPGAALRTRFPQLLLAFDSPAALEPGCGARNPDYSSPSRRGRAAVMVRPKSGAIGDREAVSGLERRVPTGLWAPRVPWVPGRKRGPGRRTRGT